MAGTCVCTVTHPVGAERSSVVTFDWVSGTGATAGTVADVGISPMFSGYITKIQTVPGLNGDKVTAVPTANYDVVINDKYGEDVAEGELADCSEAVANSIYSAPKVKIDSDLIVGVTNAGDTKKGRIVVFISPEVDGW